MRRVGYSLAIASSVLATVLATPAAADCAADLTRIQTAAANVSVDIRTVVEGLAATAQARLKAMDAKGCNAATAQALRLMGLAPLAPLVLSTPVPGVDRNPHPPAPSASGQAAAPAPAPAGQSATAQTPPKGEALAKSAPAAPASPATPAAPAIPSTAQTTAKDAAGPKATAKSAGTTDWYIVTSDFIGRPVTSQDNPGDSIGFIKGIAIDSNTQKVVLALVETGGFLGIGGDLIAVPFSAITFNERWERPEIRTNAEVVQSGPRVTLANVTTLLADSSWRQKVGEHFGVPLVAPAAAAPPSPIPAPPAAAPKKAERPAAAPAPAPVAAPAGDAAKGHEYATMMCSGCHTFDPNGGTRVGPNLNNVLGRPVASVAGFTYSQGLRKHGGTWDAATLNTFLQSPQHFASGTVMAFPGIPTAEDRANVIAYLKSIETAQGAPK